MPFGISAGAGAAIAGGLSAAGGIASAAMQSGATSRAAGQSTRNLQLMLPQMQQNYNRANQLMQPYTDVGPGAIKLQQDLLGLNGPDAAAAARNTFQTSPGYQWTVDQAMRATNASAAQGEMLHSGATLKALQDRASNLANQEFGNYYGRLGNLANIGFQGASADIGAGNNLINGMTGNVQAQNAVNLGAANAQNSILGNATSGLSNTVNSLFSNPSFQNWISGNSSTNPSTLNNTNPTMNYGGSVFGTGGQSFPSFNPFSPAPVFTG